MIVRTLFLTSCSLGLSGSWGCRLIGLTFVGLLITLLLTTCFTSVFRNQGFCQSSVLKCWKCSFLNYCCFGTNFMLKYSSFLRGLSSLFESDPKLTMILLFCGMKFFYELTSWIIFTLEVLTVCLIIWWVVTKCLMISSLV